MLLVLQSGAAIRRYLNNGQRLPQAADRLRIHVLLKRGTVLFCLFLSFCTALVSGAQPIPQNPHPGSQRSTSLVQVVTPADPQVQWAAPLVMATGDPLTAMELDATAAVPGNFAYTPSQGTLLPEGTQTLTVRFTPNNPNFAPATKTVSVQVVPPNGVVFSLNVLDVVPVVQRGDQFTQVQTKVNITPVGTLNQVVHLSCVASPGVSCVFDPNAVRPGSTAVPITLTIRVPRFWLLQPACVLPVLCLLFLRRRMFTVVLPGLITFGLAGALTGCGTTQEGLHITVIAATSTQSHAVDLDPRRLGLYQP